MAYGSQNELIIFPIIDLIRSEIKRMVSNGEIASEDFQSRALAGNIFTNITNDNKYTKTVNYSNILSMLESNDYELTLERKEPEFPNRLTRVFIKYSEYLIMTITLLREANKLNGVTMVISSREPKSKVLNNPLGMTSTDYINYVRNGIMWEYYNKNVVHFDKLPPTDPPTPPPTDLEIQDALSKMNLYHISNQEIRNTYGIVDSQVPPHDELMKYMPNPLAMDEYDYIDYCIAKWIHRNEANYVGITPEVKETAHLKAVALREKYGIVGELQDFYYLIKYVSYNRNLDSSVLPLFYAVHTDDLVKLYELKKKIAPMLENPSDYTQEELDTIQSLQSEKIALGNKYYITDWQNAEMSWNLIEPHLPKDTSEYVERTILSVNISLNYLQGKLQGVKSELVEGDV